jgi:antitoxin MazE
MNMMIRSKVVKIGNSRGIRIPRTVLEHAGLTDQVEMTIEGNKLIIQAFRHSRQGWEDHFADMAKQEDNQLLDETPLMGWDDLASFLVNFFLNALHRDDHFSGCVYLEKP